MKNIFILIGLLLIFASCSKDFMEADIRELTEERKNEILNKSPKDKVAIIESELQAVYSVIRMSAFNGNTRHDYFGLKSMHLATDLSGADMVQTKHHWFGFDYKAENRMATYSRTKLMWGFLYKMVSSSNDFLDKYLQKATAEEVVALKGKVLAIRGIAYFHLVNYYQLTYKGNENKLGVPIVLKSGESSKARATVKEVYEQIIKDLTNAVDNAGYTPKDTKDADSKVAAAYLAKTYAAMEDWENVEKYARIAIKDVSFTMATSFSESDNADVLWGAPINVETTDIYASFPAHMSSNVDGYTGAIGAYKAVSSSLYEKILGNDARKGWFLDTINKPDKFKNLPDYANMKFNSPEDFTGDYVYIRSADPYLLLVEALAEQGKTGDAKSELKSFLASRGISGEVDKHSSDLIDFIRLQRRIELWGEGTSLFDIKRWDMPIVREGTNHTQVFNIDHPATSYKLVYQIPQGEIEQNPKLVQNP